MIAFVIMVSVSGLLTLTYLIWGYFFHPALKKPKDGQQSYDRNSYLFRAIVMFLCPVVAPLAFFLGFVIHKVFLTAEIDLAHVTFSKERVKTVSRGNEERDRNLVPLEEAIAVSDKSGLRTLMLNVIKGDVKKSLSAISLALNSEDSETAHYAASVLLDELNDFRENVQKIHNEIAAGGDEVEEYCLTLIPYMNNVLQQKVFADIEQKNFVLIMEQAGDALYTRNKSKMDASFYEWICSRLLDIREFEIMEKWSARLTESYPNSLQSYTCRLKLYFTTHNKDKFFTVLQELEASSVIIDQETLELIRIFS